MKTKQASDFKKAYQKLKAKDGWKLSIEFYHHDFISEPFLHGEFDTEKIVLDYVEEHGLIITLIMLETSFSFSEKNWSVHVAEDYISFGSKHDDDTHCIIEFC